MPVATTRSWLPWLAVAVIVLGVANFIAFVIVSAALGGDALNGHVADGHYYVASHGAYTEVSRAVWAVSRAHAAITLLSWPLVMVAMAFLMFRYVFPFLVSGKAPGQSSERVAALRASGTQVWQGSPGGRVGMMRASAGLLGVEVYPGGIVVKPLFMPASAIRADEIRSFRLARRFLTGTIEVEHTGIDVSSPLVLYGGADSPQARALLTLASHEAPIATSSVAQVWPTAEAAIRPVPGPMRVLGLLGLVVAAVMIVAGVLFVIPSLGPFGAVWTGLAVVILIIDGRRFIHRGW